MKEEALAIADKLGNPDLCSWQKPTKEASAMIRRLVEELDKHTKNEFKPDWNILQTLLDENIRLSKELGAK